MRVDADGIDAGGLIHRVTIEAPTSDQNDYGEDIRAWAEVCTVWACVEELSGTEGLSAQQLHASATHKITMRYRPGISAKQRARFRERTLEIGHVEDFEHRHVALILTCTEDRPNG